MQPFNNLNIESEHINAVNRTKNCHSTLIFVNISTNDGGALGWPSTWHNCTDAQIRALDQPQQASFNFISLCRPFEFCL